MNDMTNSKLKFHADLLIAPREFANSVRMCDDTDYRAMLGRVCASALGQNPIKSQLNVDRYGVEIVSSDAVRS